MRVLVCGSRGIDDQSIVMQALVDCPWSIETIVHGNARGVDRNAKQYALRHDIEHESHPIPEWVWDRIGDKAGPMRNGYMIEHTDAVVAVWDGESAGTEDAIAQATANGMPVYKVYCHEQDGSWVIERMVLDEGSQKQLDSFAHD